MTDEPMTGDCFDEEHDPLSDCLEHYTKLQKEYDALKAKLEYAEARIALLSRLGDGSDEAIAQRDAKIADIEASQTRWVKCSERMPEKAGEYLFVRISDGEVFQEVVWWDARPGMKYQMWDAWLENVPEIVP